jgi:hypothetical protein
MTDASDKEMRILDIFSLNENQAPRVAAKISSGGRMEPTACICSSNWRMALSPPAADSSLLLHHPDSIAPMVRQIDEIDEASSSERTP